MSSATGDLTSPETNDEATTTTTTSTTIKNKISFKSKESHVVGRGPITIREAKDRRNRLERDVLSKMTPSQRERMKTHFYGSNADLHVKRRHILREDDSKNEDNEDNLVHLSDSARQALRSRRQTSNKNGTKPKKKKDRIVSSKIALLETKRIEAAAAAADAEVILNTTEAGFMEPEHDMERTSSITQTTLKQHYLDRQTARQIFDLNLNQYGPYGMSYDRSGRKGLLYGQKGHVAIMDNCNIALSTEFHLQQQDVIRDATFLHNDTMFALAQRRNLFIYDDAGIEIHRMDDHIDPLALQFLPYHWLLASIGRSGVLKYHDTSTGQHVATHRTKLGPCSVLRQNPSNAILHSGHSNGTVTLWSPAHSEYIVKLQCHIGSPVSSLAIDSSGRYMVTGGAADQQVKIWDLRMYRETHAYYTPRGAGPPSSLDVSQRSVLGIGFGSHTLFWPSQALTTKVKSPYMKHELPGHGPIHTLKFRPNEDVCAIGHAHGISSIVIPGCANPTLDSSEYGTNPYADKNQRREGEIRSLLDKLSPDTIALDPHIVGTIEESDLHKRYERRRHLEEQANARKEKDEEMKKNKKPKNRMRGRNKIQAQIQRKKKNVIDENVMKLRAAKEAEEQMKRNDEAERMNGGDSTKDNAPTALKRFF